MNRSLGTKWVKIFDLSVITLKLFKASKKKRQKLVKVTHRRLVFLIFIVVFEPIKHIVVLSRLMTKISFSISFSFQSVGGDLQRSSNHFLRKLDPCSFREMACTFNSSRYLFGLFMRAMPILRYFIEGYYVCF